MSSLHQIRNFLISMTLTIFFILNLFFWYYLNSDTIELFFYGISLLFFMLCLIVFYLIQISNNIDSRLDDLEDQWKKRK